MNVPIPIVQVMAIVLGISPGRAVMFWETGDPTRNTSTPGDNSGWQYEGTMDGYLGVPIAPYFFISAKHIAEHNVGDVFYFHGDAYTTVDFFNSPTTDLRIWQVDVAKPFPTFAALSSGVNDIGAVAAIYGKGTQRGAAFYHNAEHKGWAWGTPDGVQRWGRNVVEGEVNAGSGLGKLLFCDFNRNGIAHECHLSVGDSGGGMFVLENGLWRLAGIHNSVNGSFRRNSSEGAGYLAALFDFGGMEIGSNSTSWTPIPEDDDDVPSGFYSSRISASLTWITSTATGSGVVAAENFAAWQKLYFTPAQIADSTLSGPLADFDKDGIVNLLEFAFHLDPIFNEQKILDAGTGFRGLPLVQKEVIEGEERLTIEFLRRKNSNGAALTYTHEFSSTLDGWSSVGTVDVESINERWERVKVIDSLTRAESPKRFGGVRVTMSE
jgi:hypothetical protein